MQTHQKRPSFAVILVVAVMAVCWGTGCTPSGPRALLQGEELIRKGNYERAVDKLKLAVNLMPNEAQAWNFLGLAQHGAGAYGEAIIAYKRAQELNRDLAIARYNLGELYLEQGNPMSAADELIIYTSLDPKSVQGWLRLGDALYAIPQLERSLNAYYTALQLDRELPAAYNGVGLIHVQRKNSREAQRYFIEALRYDPDYAPAILNLAVMAHQAPGGLPSALNRYREYLSKAPDAPNAGDVRGVIQQIELQLNPSPVVVETEVPKTNPAPATVIVQVPNNKPAIAVATNAPVPPAVDSPKTAVVQPPRTNALPVAATAPKTNAPVPAQASASKPPSTPTNKPPVVAVQAAPTNRPAENASTLVTAKPAETAKPATKPEQPTNRVAVAANTPFKDLTEATPNQAATTPPRETVSDPQPAIEETPLEVVAVEESPIADPEEIAPAAPLTPAATRVQPTQPPASVPVVASTRTTPEPEEDKGFFQRINPVNLFKRDKSEPPPKRTSDMITPLPGDPPPSNRGPEETPATTPPRVVSLPDEPARETAAVERATDSIQVPTVEVAVPRYRYGRITAPKAGDRSAAERLFERGVGAQSRRDTASATTFFGAAAEADPTYFPAHYNLGLAAYSSGQWTKALSAFETALVLDPSSSETRYNFALTLQKAGYPTDAAEELERLTRASAGNVRAHLLLGNVYSQDLGKTNEARQHYQRVLVLEPRHPQATAIRYWLAEHP